MNFGGLFDVEVKEKRLDEIKELESLDDFWQDQSAVLKIQKEKSHLASTVGKYQKLVDLRDELDILLEYIKDGDEDLIPEAIQIFNDLKGKVSDLRTEILLSGETDKNNAIVSINAGAGGTESCDWAFMLHRMILRWAESKSFNHKLLDYQSGDTAGIKSSTVLIEGDFSYGLLKSESGIHRLVRISPFDSNKRRHTSFASIFVSPEIDDEIKVEVLDKDLKIEVFRAGGAGGQSVNTTDSAVRMTHMPSGIVVVCQNERSQLQNKQMALKILKSRLYEKQVEEKRKEQEEAHANKKEIGWGSQIRSYVLHPYKMVKDHRTGLESGTPDKVLDGELDDFMKSYLEWMVHL